MTVPELDAAILSLAHTHLPSGGHTPLDFAELVAAGVDPTGKQARERAVPCQTPGCRAETFNLEARCNNLAHYLPPRSCAPKQVA
jgi:hypothetical protein